MSWAEIKKALNEKLDLPLNKQIVFTPTTTAVRNAFASAMGFTQRSTISVTGVGTVYLYWKNASVKNASWDEAYEICTNYWKHINEWAVEQGYGNICIASRMPAYTDTGSWLPSGTTWTGTQYTSVGNHYTWSDSYYNGGNDYFAFQVVPVALII